MNKNNAVTLTQTKQILFLSFLFILSVTIAEISLQIFYRATAGQWLWQWWAVPIYEPDYFRVYRVKSNLNYCHKTIEYSARYYTNVQGFRTDSRQLPTTLEKPRDTYRVMYLGPSFTFGWGVDFEQSYAYLISSRLCIPKKAIEIINVGTPAQPMNYQLAWLAHFGYRYSPDLIVQTVYSDCCESMAVDGALPENIPYVKDGYLYPPPPKTFGEATQQTIRRYRRYCAILFFAWRLYAAVAGSKERAGLGQELYTEPAGGALCDQNVILERYRAYQRFVHDALSENVPIVFVYVPLAYIVRPADIIRVKHQGNYKDPLIERSRTREAQQILNDNGIHFLDLSDELADADRKTRMYNLYDIHFTPAGNQVAANAATPIIQKIIGATLLKGGRRKYSE